MRNISTQMSKKNWNPSASKTVYQINSTLDMLQEKALCITYNYVPPVEETQHCCQITWYNHVSGRENGGKSFLKLEQYLHILQTNSYHCLLFDGSVIRVNFEFEDDFLLVQNLLWWPAPYDYGGILREGYPPVDIMNDFYCEKQWYKVIKMRSPLRIDFDSRNNTESHPHSHLHIEHEDTRLNTGNPICFNRFIDFIFRNFYPELSLRLSESDFITYKIPELETLRYSSSQMRI